MEGDDRERVKRQGNFGKPDIKTAWKPEMVSRLLTVKKPFVFTR
jgi:hypothetical protein